MKTNKCYATDNLFQGDAVVVSGDMCRKMTYGDIKRGIDFHVSLENAAKGSLVEVVFHNTVFDIQE